MLLVTFRAARFCFKSGIFILQVTEYERAGAAANEAIAEAVGRYLHDVIIERAEAESESKSSPDPPGWPNL